MITKDDIRSLARSEQFISGIYNYCDGWCARCEFTSRCLGYATRQLDSSDPKTKDEPVMDHVMRMFTIAGEMIEDEARSRGIDLGDLDTKGWRKQDVESLLPKQSFAYFRAVQDWFDQRRSTIGPHDGEDSVSSRLRLVDAPESNADQIRLALETVSRLSSLIHVKIVRALWRPLESDVDTFDSNGSGKCALVAIDRSIEAWKEIDQTIGGCVGFGASLGRIRKSLEYALPEARQFVRPGLDGP
jgi:hypothetical protein